VPYLSDSVVVIHYEEALYQVHAPLPLYFIFTDRENIFHLIKSRSWNRLPSYLKLLRSTPYFRHLMNHFCAADFYFQATSNSISYKLCNAPPLASSQVMD